MKPLNESCPLGLCLLIFLMLCVGLAHPLRAQEKLKKLVIERENLHKQWQESESQKSGLFGNRTKKDMITTHEWMSRIIEKDNHIVAELQLLKDIETTTITHEKEDYKFIAQKQQNDIDILKRALAEKEGELENIKSENLTNERTAFLLFLSTVVFGFLYANQKRKGKREPAH